MTLRSNDISFMFPAKQPPPPPPPLCPSSRVVHSFKLWICLHTKIIMCVLIAFGCTCISFLQWAILGANISNIGAGGIWTILFHLGLGGECTCAHVCSVDYNCVAYQSSVYLFIIWCSIVKLFCFLTGILGLYYCFWTQLVNYNLNLCVM